MKGMTLRKRLFLYSTLIIVLLMLGVIFLAEKRLSKGIRSELEKRGQALAKNLAAVSANALVVYNYIALEQMAERASQAGDILYIVICDKENRVAVFTNHDERQGEILTDSTSQAALRARCPVVQRAIWNGREILDFTAPVFISQSDEKWGTVRVGLSLDKMHEEIKRTRLGLAGIGTMALAVGFVGSVIYARRITQPLKDLVRGTILVSRGDLDQKIDVRTGDEVEELARNFAHMVEEVRAHRRELETQICEISALKRYQENILQSMMNGVIAIDLEGRITTINQAAFNILDGDEQSLLHTHLAMLPQPWDVLGRVLMETLETGRGTRNRELRIQKGDRSLWILLTTTPLVDAEERRLGALGVFQDVTDLRDLQERMIQAERLAALGRLSAGLAHEIKNPLSAIKTFVQLIPQKFDRPSFRDKLNTTVPRELERINRLVDNLLQLTRKPRLTLSSLEINEILAQTTELYQGEMDRRNVMLQMTFGPEMPRIQGDAELLHRVFSNIILNAIQAMPGGGEFTVSTSPPSAEGRDGCLQAIFQDTGVGMDPETVGRLFDPFFTTKEKGTGLGMANSKRIVEEHGGAIEVQSTPGKGTRVVVSLPVEGSGDQTSVTCTVP
jgi:PAS domain S-box-containing protein